jgi:endonuclease YncB( thermonuclease family)
VRRFAVASIAAAASIWGGFAALRAEPWQAVDGDTVRHRGLVIRVENIDAPETGGRARCAAERRLGNLAKRRAHELLDVSEVDVVFVPGKRLKDRYGRSLGRIVVTGRDLGEILVAEGLARRWNGKRRPWCSGGNQPRP